MGPLALLGFASLWAGLALAEVVSDFSKCKEYFYKETAPKGFDDQNRANICQRYKSTYHFATCYDKSSRIPVWSAYNIHERRHPGKEEKVWKVEPQLSDPKDTSEKNMKKESDVKPDVNLKTNQAISEDYSRTDYHRGHLNPNSFQNAEGRKATFTLTNAVPMDPSFNKKHWCNLERNLKKLLKEKCINLGGTPFLVTGAVPDPNHKIPIKDNKGDSNRDTERVVVPSHIWTAVCCQCSKNNEEFSFAFLAKNSPDSILNAMEVTELDNELTKLYGKSSIKIFIDNCNEKSTKSAEALVEIKKELNSRSPQCDDEAESPDEKKPKLSPGRKRKSLSGSGSSLEGGGREAA